MLSATVGASGDVQLQVLLESRQAFVEFFGEPARKRLGLGDRDLAELSAGAGDDATAKWRSLDRQTGQRQSVSDARDIRLRHVDNQQILHVGRTKLAPGIAFGEIGSRVQLVGSNAA